MLHGGFLLLLHLREGGDVTVYPTSFPLFERSSTASIIISTVALNLLRASAQSTCGGHRTSCSFAPFSTSPALSLQMQMRTDLPSWFVSLLLESNATCKQSRTRNAGVSSRVEGGTHLGWKARSYSKGTRSQGGRHALTAKETRSLGCGKHALAAKEAHSYLQQKKKV